MRENNWMAFAAIGIVVAVLFGIYVEVSVWQECRTDHSFLYCLRLISR